MVWAVAPWCAFSTSDPNTPSTFGWSMCLQLFCRVHHSSSRRACISPMPILGQDLPYSVSHTVPASSDATVGGRSRQFERSRDASIVPLKQTMTVMRTTDDERHPLVPRDVVSALESDLAVEVDWSAEENTPVGRPSLPDALSWCHKLVLRSQCQLKRIPTMKRGTEGGSLQRSEKLFSLWISSI